MFPVRFLVVQNDRAARIRRSPRVDDAYNQAWSKLSIHEQRLCWAPLCLLVVQPRRGELPGLCYSLFWPAAGHAVKEEGKKTLATRLRYGGWSRICTYPLLLPTQDFGKEDPSTPPRLAYHRTIV